MMLRIVETRRGLSPRNGLCRNNCRAAPSVYHPNRSARWERLGKRFGTAHPGDLSINDLDNTRGHSGASPHQIQRP